MALKESSLLGEGIPLVPLLCQTPWVQWTSGTWSKSPNGNPENHRPNSKPSFSGSMLIFQGFMAFFVGRSRPGNHRCQRIKVTVSLPALAAAHTLKMENRTAGKPRKVRILVDVYTVCTSFLEGNEFQVPAGSFAEHFCDPSWGLRGKAVRKINL